VRSASLFVVGVVSKLHCPSRLISPCLSQQCAAREDSGAKASTSLGSIQLSWNHRLSLTLAPLFLTQQLASRLAPPRFSTRLSSRIAALLDMSMDGAHHSVTDCLRQSTAHTALSFAHTETSTVVQLGTTRRLHPRTALSVHAFCS